MSLFNSRFYDFNVHKDSTSITELAFGAKKYGYCGIAIVNSAITNEDKLPEDFSIYGSVEISGKPSKLREEIKKHKGTDAILTVIGGDEELNRAAVETEGLDILLQPAQFNNVLAKAASDNSVAIGFNLGSLVRLRGEARVRELMIMRENLKHARKYDLRMILTGTARSIYDFRSPREMAAIAGIFGMTKEEAVDAMSAAPLEILRRKNPDYIQEGIEIL
ncbi:MAG: ribonuclease P protein component 3 [Candidatus Methanoperedens sp.]|nr:ribonuclease P protein component 3 [Candidatus Methanoperedens sp.]